jgi:2-dehydro-3-deoxygalactonokinase
LKEHRVILAIEWTSAAFHAFLFEEDGTLIDQRQQAHGVNHITDGGFEAALRDMAGDWAAGASHVYLTGMITSRNGWIETPYAPTPASLHDVLAKAITKKVDGLAPLIFLPGVSVQHPLPDMMRGEELKIIGAMDKGSGLVALPGVHTKWAKVESGSITGFATYMTGEIAALLKASSLVGRLIPAESADNPEAFLRGARMARDRSIGGNVLRRIFSARSMVLFDELAPFDISDYLSGLLIGAEIDEALQEFSPPDRHVTLIGPTALCRRYALVLREAGMTSTIVENAGVSAFRALALIARQTA